MTELDQARAHLRRCQAVLRDLRCGQPHSDAIYQLARTQASHDSLLAALSWVWDAQDRAKEQRAREEASEFFSSLGFDPVKILIDHPDNAVDTWSAVGLVKELKILGVT